MKLTPQEAEKFWEFSLCMKIDAKFLEFTIMEKCPKKVKFPILNNQVKKIKDAADAISKEAAYSLTVKNEDYSNDHTYALYRIYNVLRTACKDELEKIASSLEEQSKQSHRMYDPEISDVQQELINESYDLELLADKKRVLSLIRKIKKERQVSVKQLQEAQ